MRGVAGRVACSLSPSALSLSLFPLLAMSTVGATRRFASPMRTLRIWLLLPLLASRARLMMRPPETGFTT
eukprot:2357557-Pleurochrysis_carterae.AAC.1